MEWLVGNRNVLLMTKLHKKKTLMYFSYKMESIKFTKPINVRFCLLGLSKFLMYEWCYDKMQP